MALSSSGPSFQARLNRKSLELADHFAGSSFLSDLFEVPVIPNNFHSIATSSNSDGLNSTQHSDILRRLGTHWEEVRSLAAEPDREMFFSQLLNLGQRLEGDEHLESAARVFAGIHQTILAHPEWSELREIGERAQAQLAVLQGGGQGALRSEFFLRRLASESLDSSVLLGMGAATIASRFVHLGVLGRLALNPEASLWTRGLFPRLAAGFLSYSAEAVVFPSVTRLTRSVLTGSPLLREGFGGELASSFLLLGALQLSGKGATTLFNRMHGIDPILGSVTRLKGFTAFSQSFFPQAAMLSGIVTANLLEERLGLRTRQDGVNRFTDSLLTLLQFNLAGETARSLLGPSFQAWDQGIRLSARVLSEGYFRDHSLRFGNEAGPLKIWSQEWVSRLLPQTSSEVTQGNGTLAVKPDNFISHIVFSTGKGDGGIPGTIQSSLPPVSEERVLGSTSDVRQIEGRSREVFWRSPSVIPFALESSLKKFIRLHDRLPYAVGVFEVQEGQGIGQMVGVNQKMESLLGYGADEMMQLSLLDFFDGRDRRLYSTLLQKFPNTENFALREVRLLRKDGSNVFADIHGGIEEFDGYRLGFAFIEDVSERRRAAEALNISKAQNDAILRAIPDMIFQVTRDGTILDYRNPGVFLVPQDQVVGNTLRTLPLSPEHQQRALGWIAQALDTQQLVRAEFELPMPDGTVRNREARIVATGPDRVVGIVRDITDLKQAEQQKLALERIGILKSVSQHLAHDANNLLAVLVNYMELAQRDLSQLAEIGEIAPRLSGREGEFWEYAREQLKVFLDEAKKFEPRAEAIPNPENLSPSQLFFVFSRLLKLSLGDLEAVSESGKRIQYMIGRFRKLTADPSPLRTIDLNDLLKINVLHAYLNGEDQTNSPIRLSMQMDPAPWPITGHDDIPSVIENLFFNARDALAGRPNPQVRLETSKLSLTKEEIASLGSLSPLSHANPGEFMRIRVQDNGSGIEAEVQGRIFEEGFTTKRKSHEGSGHGGFGLAITRKLIEDTNGFIAVRSQPGEGTIFDVYLPRAQESSGAHDLGLKERVLATSILLVDDEEAMLRVTVRNLKKQGYEKIHTATDVPSAISVLSEHPDIGAVVFDLNLPGARGTVLMNHLQKNHPDAAQILVTGEDAGAYASYMGDLGTALSKPLPAGILNSTLFGLIAKSIRRR